MAGSNNENNNNIISNTNTCPRCMLGNTSLVGNSHYVCNTPTCFDDKGNKTQFIILADTKIMFPFNVIYPNVDKSKFFRKPYLILQEIGTTADVE